MAFATSLHSPQEGRTFAAAIPGQSEPSPNREINVVRRLPQTTSLTAVRMAVSSISQQTADSSASYLILGAATDGYADEQDPTELSWGKRSLTLWNVATEKIGCAVNYGNFFPIIQYD